MLIGTPRKFKLLTPAQPLMMNATRVTRDRPTPRDCAQTIRKEDWSIEMQAFASGMNHEGVVPAAPEFQRELDEEWRTVLRDSERPFIRGTRLLSQLRMEYALYLSFRVRRALQGVAIPDAPHMDEGAALDFFFLISNCRFYLEYGSGGSTVLAAALNKPLISVETDRVFLKRLRRKIGTITGAQRFVHADIGLTGPWGIPFPGGKPSPRRLVKWKAYPKAPWRFVKNDYPDLVLIDGRFRVAATLTSCVHLSASSDAQILVDDYLDNPCYHIIEKYAKLDRTLGRMAVFRPVINEQSSVNTVIDQYCLDWR